MNFDFANVLVFLLLGAITAGLMLGLGSLLRPQNPSGRKLSTYECGEPPSGSAWINFNIRFYLIALVFVIFDVEVAFIFPVAVAFRDMALSGKGLLALGEVFAFLLVLMVGLVYVWAKRDLEWLRPVEERRA